jgi:hypothetical protein
VEIRDDAHGLFKTLALTRSDSLEAIPRSYRKILLPAIEAWWKDPREVLRSISEKAFTPNMREWFRCAINDGTFELYLHKASFGNQASLDVSCPSIRGAELTPPEPDRSFEKYPAGLRELFALLGDIQWCGYLGGGGIDGPDGLLPLRMFEFDYHGADIEIDRAFGFGSCPGGDKIIATLDGQGGFLNHSSHEIHLHGTITETVDWVFGELLANRCPDFFYQE